MGEAERTIALVVAAGSGSRAGSDMPKQYRRIGGRSVLAHAVAYLRAAGLDEVRVIIGAGQENFYRDAVDNSPLPAFIVGGAERQDSVRNGLEAIDAEGGAARILIHDAARPFVPAVVIERLLGALDEREAAVPVLPVVDTLARGDGALGETVAREGLVRVQTPQAFRFETI